MMGCHGYRSDDDVLVSSSSLLCDTLVLKYSNGESSICYDQKKQVLSPVRLENRP